MKPKKRKLALQLWWCCSLVAFVICALLAAYYWVQSADHKRAMEQRIAYVMGTEESTQTVAAVPDENETLPEAEAVRSENTAMAVEITPQASVAPKQRDAITADAQASSAPLSAEPVLKNAASSASTLSAQDAALLQRYHTLADENPDMIGWLRIDGTAINEPVMYTPNDSQHYLNLDFQGGYSTSGQLFLDGSCDPGSSPGNKIIYGHNMRDGTRFADLKRFLERDFFQSQPTIRFDTLEELGNYQVIAAFKLDVVDLDEPSMLCYNTFDTTSDDVLDRLHRYIDKYAALHTQGLYPRKGDQLLTLSTCGRVGSNERVVVMARRLLEGEN